MEMLLQMRKCNNKYCRQNRKNQQMQKKSLILTLMTQKWKRPPLKYRQGSKVT